MKIYLIVKFRYREHYSNEGIQNGAIIVETQIPFTTQDLISKCEEHLSKSGMQRTFSQPDFTFKAITDITQIVQP